MVSSRRPGCLSPKLVGKRQLTRTPSLTFKCRNFSKLAPNKATGFLANAQFAYIKVENHSVRDVLLLTIAYSVNGLRILLAISD